MGLEEIEFRFLQRSVSFPLISTNTSRSRLSEVVQFSEVSESSCGFSG